MNIYEVGPRDGLQNCSVNLKTIEKIKMVEDLHRAGLKNIEVTSFVHPKRVPQLADAEIVFEETRHLGDLDVLIPNRKGYERAKNVGAKNLNVFFSHSDEFNFRNLGKTFDEAFPDIQNMLVEESKENVRAYVSCAFGCPFEYGMPDETKLKNVIQKADEIADTVVLCDTIGAAYPSKMLRILNLTRGIDAEVALHLHENKNGVNDIFTNVKSAVEWGITNFDSSIAGLGGCPFIPDSGNNLSTNQLINWANNNGYETGIELDNLAGVTDFILRETKLKLIA